MKALLVAAALAVGAMAVTTGAAEARWHHGWGYHRWHGGWGYHHRWHDDWRWRRHHHHHW